MKQSPVAEEASANSAFEVSSLACLSKSLFPCCCGASFLQIVECLEVRVVEVDLLRVFFELPVVLTSTAKIVF